MSLKAKCIATEGGTVHQSPDELDQSNDQSEANHRCSRTLSPLLRVPRPFVALKRPHHLQIFINGNLWSTPLDGTLQTSRREKSPISVFHLGGRGFGARKSCDPYKICTENSETPATAGESEGCGPMLFLYTASMHEEPDSHFPLTDESQRLHSWLTLDPCRY